MVKQRIGVVGGGIIGLAIAYKMQLKYPSAEVILLEKESNLGCHQSGRNSGVLHCGLYYEPGSLKAKLAVSGIKQMIEFCQTWNIPHEICGKVVVASDYEESKRLDNLAERGKRNGLQGLTFLDKETLKRREPHISAYKSLLVPEEGIVDYMAVMQQLGSLITEKGGKLFFNEQVGNIHEESGKLTITTQQNEFQVDLLINCTGLFSDRVYQKFSGNKRPLRIIPFRGEYLRFKTECKDMVNHLVYPVPDPQYPFLGVHFTRMMNGEREVGPNAVFSFKREGYKNTDFSFFDTIDSLFYKGFLNFLLKNFSFSVSELASSIYMPLFLKKAQKMMPDLTSAHLERGNAGVRAQAMDGSGKLLMDFNVIRLGKQIHVLNAPSPGATASLAIADYIIEEYV